MRMLQGQIALRKTETTVAVIGPGFLVVGALFFVPAGEKSGRALISIAKIFTQNAGRVGVVNHVIAEEKIVLDNMADEATEKRDVGTGADRDPNIGESACSRKS